MALCLCSSDLSVKSPHCSITLVHIASQRIIFLLCLFCFCRPIGIPAELEEGSLVDFPVTYSGWPGTVAPDRPKVLREYSLKERTLPFLKKLCLLLSE